MNNDQHETNKNKQANFKKESTDTKSNTTPNILNNSVIDKKEKVKDNKVHKVLSDSLDIGFGVNYIIQKTRFYEAVTYNHRLRSLYKIP